MSLFYLGNFRTQYFLAAVFRRLLFCHFCTLLYFALTSITRLEAIRAENEVFDTSAEFGTVYTGSDSVLGVYIEYENQKLLSYFNFGEKEQTVFLDGFKSGKDLFSNEEIRGITSKLKPFGFLWLLLDE